MFDGKQIITEDSLGDIATVSQYRAEDTTLHEQERDTGKLWNGYGINLVMLGIENQMKPEELNRFHSDFRIVAEYFINAYTNAEYTPDDAVITHVDEFLKLMQVLTGDNRYEEIARSFVGIKKEGGIKMCNVLDAREARGEARLGKLISLLLEKNLLEEAKEVAENKKVREEYLAWTESVGQRFRDVLQSAHERKKQALPYLPKSTQDI